MPKYGLSVSGDVVEAVERSKGGITAILADGQGHGQAARKIASLVVSRAAALICEGARDGAVARAAHDILFAAKEGKVSCELVLISADLDTRTIVISRNTAVPVYVRPSSESKELREVNEPSYPLGTERGRRPQITELPLRPGLVALATSDGVHDAGLSSNTRFGLEHVRQFILGDAPIRPSELAEQILLRAVSLDKGRPRDDMSVVVLAVSAEEDEHMIRRLSMRIPF